MSPPSSPSTLDALAATLAMLQKRFGNLETENQALRDKNQELSEELEEWRQGLRARSRRRRNSSKTTTDKPADKGLKKDRKSGRKKGHKGAGRRNPDTVDRRVECRQAECPDCGGALADCGVAGRRRVEDLVLRVEVTEYIRCRQRCNDCGQTTTGNLPPELGSDAPRIGPTAQALAFWLRFQAGMSLGKITRFFGEAVGLSWSQGGISQTFTRTVDKLAGTVRGVWQELLTAPILHVDETGWWEDGRRAWLHVACDTDTACYLVSPNRDRVSFHALVPSDYAGVLVTDGWGPYDCIPHDQHAGCWAHILRTIRDVWELHKQDHDGIAFEQMKAFWRGAEWFQAAWATPEQTPAGQPVLETAYARLVQLLEASPTRKLQKLGRRLGRQQDRYLLFLNRHNVPLENNQAERDLRQSVIMRRTSFGTRNETGSNTFADAMTIMQTLRKRGGDVMEFFPRAFRELARGVTPEISPAPG